VQFAPIPGPAYVSGFRSGHGVPELNTPQFASPAGAVPNIGPIPGGRLGGLGRLWGCTVCGNAPSLLLITTRSHAAPAALHTACDGMQLKRNCAPARARSGRMRAAMRCVRSLHSCEGLRALKGARASRAGAGSAHPRVTVQSVAADSHRPQSHACRLLARCAANGAAAGCKQARAPRARVAPLTARPPGARRRGRAGHEHHPQRAQHPDDRGRHGRHRRGLLHAHHLRGRLPAVRRHHRRAHRPRSIAPRAPHGAAPVNVGSAQR